jgi:hypothetical protein
MPIDNTWVKMIKSMEHQYSGGKTTCRPVKGGGEVCASEKAWSVFYATMKKKGWSDKQALAMTTTDVTAVTPKVFNKKKVKVSKDITGLTEDEEVEIECTDDESEFKIEEIPEPVKELSELSIEELEIRHAEAHSRFCKIGDQACKEHFAVANEMIGRGLSHLNRTRCDLAVELSMKMESNPMDASEMLRDKMKVCKAMMIRLNQGLAFNNGHFKGMPIEDQKRIVKNLALSIRRELIKSGCKPTKKNKQV